MADFSTGVIKASTAAVIFNTGVDYSIGLKDAFLEKAAVINLDVVAIEGYADGAVDFQSQLTNIASKSPDVLFVPDYYNTVALLSQQARNAGVTATLLGADGWDTVVEVMTDRTPVEGSYYCSGYSSEDTTPMVQEFLAAFKAKNGKDPNMFSAQGYDAAKILIDAIEKTEKGMAGKAGTEDYRKAVIAAMKATDMECVTGHVTYDEYNNPIKSAVIINIKGGEAKFWGKY
jgi:branched-chain amino acid transport system substrate-binding protein